MAGLLTCSGLTFALRLLGADNSNDMMQPSHILELTAAGTVPDFHRIPFSNNRADISDSSVRHGSLPKSPQI